MRPVDRHLSAHRCGEHPRQRDLTTLPIPPGAAVETVFAHLEALARDEGPALLPVPADDPVRTRILTEALRPGTAIDEQAALVVSTSGSTGVPKGAMLSASALTESARATHDRLGGPGVWILALPAHHIAGLQVLLRSLRAGFTPVVVDVSGGFNPTDFTEAVGRCGSAPRAYTSLVPGQLDKLLDPQAGSPEAVAALASLDAVLLGGAAAPQSLLDDAATANITVVRTYGMSETAGGCVYDGIALDGVEIDLDTEGRIWIAGPQLALGYRNAPDHRAFSRPGWFRTDDAGVWGPEGRLHVRGRLDGALSIGGLTVLPQEVERALTAVPAVASAVVVGVADRRLGQRAAAAVTLRHCPGNTVDTRRLIDELRSHVIDQLGAHSAPAEIRVMPELPLLPGGKVDRRAIERLFHEPA